MDGQWGGRVGSNFIQPVFTVLTGIPAATYRTCLENLLFQKLVKVVTPQGRGRNNGMSGAFWTELGLAVILKSRWEYLGAAIYYCLPESKPFGNYLELQESLEAIWLSPLASHMRTLMPREGDDLPKAAQLVWRAGDRI